MPFKEYPENRQCGFPASPPPSQEPHTSRCPQSNSTKNSGQAPDAGQLHTATHTPRMSCEIYSDLHKHCLLQLHHRSMYQTYISPALCTALQKRRLQGRTVSTHHCYVIIMHPLLNKKLPVVTSKPPSLTGLAVKAEILSDYAQRYTSS